MNNYDNLPITTNIEVLKNTSFHEKLLPILINELTIECFAEIGVRQSKLLKRILRYKDNTKTIKEYWAIDKWNTKRYYEDKTIEPDVTKVGLWRKKIEWLDMFYYCCNLMFYFPQLRIIRDFSLRAAEQLLKYLHNSEGYFDFVYIDTMHLYKPTIDEIYAWLPLVKNGGIIGGHGYFEKAPEVIEVVDYLFNDCPNLFTFIKSSVWFIYPVTTQIKDKIYKIKKEEKV